MFEPGDNLADYSVSRDAIILSPFKQARPTDGAPGLKPERPDDPGQVTRDGTNMFVYDSPGLEYKDARTGQRLPRVGMESGTYSTLFQFGVTNQKTGEPTVFYYKLAIEYQNGTPVGKPVFTQVDKQEFLDAYQRVQK